MTRKRMLYIGSYFLFAIGNAYAQETLSPIRPVNFSKVEITDQFWTPKIKTVSEVTIPVCIEQTEVKTPRIRNFEKVAQHSGEKHEGIYYDDSDVYKALEAIAYSLKNHPDQQLEQKADEWIDKIAAAQLPDGYLNTYYTLNGLDKRWTDMDMHEDYCAGHLIEAAVAYYNTTGKTKLLEVATRFADHIDSTFRQQNRPWVSGHQEIELALVKLYHMTKKERYLALADWFLQQRGRGYGKGHTWDDLKDPARCQDAVPLKDQKEITGHAVRAMYLYTGAADVGAATGNTEYMQAMQTVWQDVVYRNMYITGGIGSTAKNEGFSQDYDLPNASAYCETCASVGMVFWNQRMNLLTGEAKYFDILERSLYNGALDGLSYSGNRFFYGNPLASHGGYGRSEWFGTACCPSNIARLVESLGDYIYAHSDKAVWVNLFVGSKAAIPLSQGTVEIAQQTGYPWQGDVNIRVTPDRKRKFPLHIRIPGWLLGQPAPGDTYRFLDTTENKYTLQVNGKNVPYHIEKGYVVIDRIWDKNDAVSIQMPLEVKKIAANDQVVANKNRIALQRGPLVYCVEQVDNQDNAMNFIVPPDAHFTASFQKDLLGGVVTLQSKLPAATPSSDGKSIQVTKQTITAIPYFCWANRGNGEMQVWLPTKIKNVLINSKGL